MKRRIEKAKAQTRAKMEHPFRVIKRQFGYTKVRFRGIAKNNAQLVTLFALSNPWMARRALLADTGEVRLSGQDWAENPGFRRSAALTLSGYAVGSPHA